MINLCRRAREVLGLPRDHPLVNTLRSAYDAVVEAWHHDGQELQFNGTKVSLLINSAMRAYPANYEPEVIQCLTQHVKPDTIFADVGANVGVISMYVAKLMGRNRSGHVFAFEPFPKVIESLRGHLELNSLEMQITTCPFAVADQIGVENFQATWNHSCAGLLANTNARFHNSNMISVRTITLDDFFDRQGISPTILKVDVEGAEDRVLKGARRLLSSSVETVILETHPHLWVDKPKTRLALMEEIQRSNFKVTNLEPNNDALYEKGHLLLQCQK